MDGKRHVKVLKCMLLFLKCDFQFSGLQQQNNAFLPITLVSKAVSYINKIHGFDIKIISTQQNVISQQVLIEQPSCAQIQG